MNTQQSEAETSTEAVDIDAAAALIEEAPVDDVTSRETQVIEAREREFALVQRQAIALSQAGLVPPQYQGKKGIANCLIAMNLAKRMRCDPLEVMQSLNVIKEKPAWSAQFLISRWNMCGRYSPIQYKFTDAMDGCIAYSNDLKTGDTIEGPMVTMEMAAAEGWSTRTGSKWKTMPELMLRYRAAAFLIRTTAPEIGLGIYTTEEVQDIQ